MTDQISTDNQRKVKASVSRRSVILDFLGSMNLAITILVIIAIASAIGTVLQQNQPYNNYIIKFGPFWHEFFLTLNLYDIYSAGWFLILLAFLLLSLSVCIYRNTPTMLQDMRNFRLNSKLKSLKTIEGARSWAIDDVVSTEQNVARLFEVNGYQVRFKQHHDRTIIAGMRGRWNRPGYIFAHLGIIVLMIGGVMDSTLDITMREWFGYSRVDTETVFVKDIPKESRLNPSDLLSFRGNVDITEGQTANFALLRIREGNLVQHLPFAVKLKDFRVEHYESGQPKSFESDLVIIDKDKKVEFEQTISVNYPLQYRGYTIYQASFGDGGSKLEFKVWPFYDHKLRTLDVKSTVRGKRQLQTLKGDLTLEFSDFRKYNVRPAGEDDPQGKKFVNDGSSVVFKVRDSSGQAREYVNYMSPVKHKDRYVFVSGMRTNPSENFRYLHIPADDKFTVDRFMKFHALINDAKRTQQIALKTVDQVLKNAPDSDKYKQNIVSTMMDLLERFNLGGYRAIDNHVQNAGVDAEQKAKMRDAYFKVLNTILLALYMQVLEEEGIDTSKPITENQEGYYLAAVDALRQIPAYGTPFYAQLTGFTHVESSGLSIAKLPGKNVFYLGCIMSIAGIFLLLYMSHQRLWAVLYKDESGRDMLLVAGSGNRNAADFKGYFAALVEKIDSLLGNSKRQ
jgi:cytochrome c biogenesis protein